MKGLYKIFLAVTILLVFIACTDDQFEVSQPEYFQKNVPFDNFLYGLNSHIFFDSGGDIIFGSDDQMLQSDPSGFNIRVLNLFQNSWLQNIFAFEGATEKFALSYSLDEFQNIDGATIRKINEEFKQIGSASIEFDTDAFFGPFRAMDYDNSTEDIVVNLGIDDEPNIYRFSNNLQEIWSKTIHDTLGYHFHSDVLPIFSNDGSIHVLANGSILDQNNEDAVFDITLDPNGKITDIDFFDNTLIRIQEWETVRKGDLLFLKVVNRNFEGELLVIDSDLNKVWSKSVPNADVQPFVSHYRDELFVQWFEYDPEAGYSNVFIDHLTLDGSVIKSYSFDIEFYISNIQIDENGNVFYVTEVQNVGFERTGFLIKAKSSDPFAFFD